MGMSHFKSTNKSNIIDVRESVSWQFHYSRNAWKESVNHLFVSISGTIVTVFVFTCFFCCRLPTVLVFKYQSVMTDDGRPQLSFVQSIQVPSPPYDVQFDSTARLWVVLGSTSSHLMCIYHTEGNEEGKVNFKFVKDALDIDLILHWELQRSIILYWCDKCDGHKCDKWEEFVASVISSSETCTQLCNCSSCICCMHY